MLSPKRNDAPIELPIGSSPVSREELASRTQLPTTQYTKKSLCKKPSLMNLHRAHAVPAGGDRIGSTVDLISSDDEIMDDRTLYLHEFISRKHAGDYPADLKRNVFMCFLRTLNPENLVSIDWRDSLVKAKNFYGGKKEMQGWKNGVLRILRQSYMIVGFPWLRSMVKTDNQVLLLALHIGLRMARVLFLTCIFFM